MRTPACLALLIAAGVLHAPAAPPPIDRTTLTGKVMCGYQGWFCCEGDGTQRGWTHWTQGKGPPSQDNIKVDLWPDLTEFAESELFPTELKHADGRPARVFSSNREATVRRHFEWMRDYDLDGIFLQRFVGSLRDPRVKQHNDTVLAHCRRAAQDTGRTWALMYDLSGMKSGRMSEVIADAESLTLAEDDPSYLHHRGKPLLAIWGIGFNDGRDYTLAETRALVEALRTKFTLMLGLPTYWRDLKNDAVKDAALHEIIALADVVSPWTVGRYRTPAEAQHHAAKVITADLTWCREHQIDYLPVIFPGFSWHNMKGDPLNAIPRLKGEFYRTQFTQALSVGASMLYVAMFDELDEGTAIFKCTNDVPRADRAAFVDLEGLPSDHYLKLTREASELLRQR
jgi:hypothetical protein